MPSSARRGWLRLARKSSTTLSSVKWPTIGRSCDATPRSVPPSSAARARRLAALSGSHFFTRAPNGFFFEFALMYFSAVRMIHSEFFSHLSDGVAPRGDAVAAEDAADRLRVLLLDLGDVEAELEAGPAPRHPHDLLAEDLLGQLLPVGGRRDRDAGVGVQVVDVRGVDEAVHRGVDRRRGAALAVQAVVERRDHLVLAVDARVDVDQRAHPVEAEHGEAGLGQGAEVATGSLDPEQLDVLAGDGVGLGALRGGVAPGVVGVLRVRAQSVGPGDQLLRGAHLFSSILPACRRRGPLRSVPGSRSRRRPAPGSPAAHAPLATLRGRLVRRCRRRP